LGTGSKHSNAVQLAEQLLCQTNGLRGLAHANITELSACPGVGEAKAAAILALFELAKRLYAQTPGQQIQIRSPSDIANFLMLEMGLLETEQLRQVLLDTKNNVLATHTVYSGSLNTAVVRVGEVFRQAIRINAAALILVHNHPSGDPTPSPEDVRVTELIYNVGKDLDIDLLDHLIFGQNRYVSLKERGLGFTYNPSR
jgi:DNA repair protein RadC